MQHNFVPNFDVLKEAVVARAGRFMAASFETWAATELTQVNWPGRYHLRDATWIFMYWLTYYPSAHEMEARFTVGHAFVWRIVRVFINHLPRFIQLWIQIPPLVTRLHLAASNNPPFLHRCTILVDGTDCRVWFRWRQGDKKEKLYSFKFKKSAYRTQVATTADGMIVWTSESLPASIHDKRQLEESDFHQILQAGEVAMGDTGYVGLPYVWTPYKRARGRPLTAAQEFYNLSFNGTRARIEHVFGKLKNTFALLNEPYRHPKKHFTTLFRTCCALYNVDRFIVNRPELWDQINFRNWADINAEQADDGEEGGGPTHIGGLGVPNGPGANPLGFGNNNNLFLA